MNDIIQSTEFLLPQSVVSNGTVTGTGFTDPDNILLRDGVLASSADGNNQASDITIGNFPLALPQDAVITGIRFEIFSQKGGQTVPPIYVLPSLYDNTDGANDYYAGTQYTGLTTDLEEHILGSQTDLWGKTDWTVDQINNIKLNLTANGEIQVDTCTIEVFYYVLPVPTPPDPSEEGCEDCNSTIQAQPFKLANTFRADDTKFILYDFNLPNGTPITLDMLGGCGGEIAIVFDKGVPKIPGGNFEENAVITSADATITQLPNGYIEIDLGTIENRALMFNTPYTHDADLLSEHAVNSTVIITNSARYQNRFLQKCHIGVLVSAPIYVEDESVALTDPVHTLDFQGSGVSVANDSVDSFKKIVTISGGGGSGHEIQDNGVAMPTEPALNFIDYFTLTDVPGVSTDVAIDVVGLAGDTTFINTLTSNVNFQNAVNTFVSGSGVLQIDQTPDNGTFGLLAGDVDGVNDTYTVSLGAYAAGKLQVYLNGLVQLQGASDDYIELVPGSGTFQFNTPPATNDIITVVYSGSASVVDNYTVKATTNDTAPSYLDDKISLTSTDGSVSITKTLNNPAGNEDIEYDLSVSSTPSLYSVPNYDLVEPGSSQSVYELQDGTYFTSPANNYSVSPDKTKVYKLTISYTGGSNYNLSLEEYTGNGSGSIGTLATTYTGSGSHTVGNNTYTGAFYVNGTSVFVPLANGTNIPYYTEYTISGTSLVSPTTTNFTYDTIGANNTKSYWFSDGTYYYVWNPDGSGNVKKYTYSVGTFTLVGTSSGVSSLTSTQSIFYQPSIYRLLVNYFKIEGGKVVNFTCLKTSASTLASPVIVSGVLLANNVSAP